MQLARTLAVPVVNWVWPMAQISVARLLVSEHLRDVLDLGFGQAGDALDLVRRSIRDFLADILDAVDALVDEFLVLPAVLENVPEHAIDGRDMCTPGRTRTYSVACAAVRVMRGSTTIKLARLSSLPSRMCCSDTGCASAGLPPMIKIVFELRMSL